ncbi:hypothetical protein Hanom_Chr14g01309261 [Helianthus anomalus]
MYYFRTMDCVGLISDIRFIIRIRIQNFGYPKFRIRIRIVKSTIRNVRISDFRISEISDIRNFGYPVLNTPGVRAAVVVFFVTTIGSTPTKQKQGGGGRRRQ